MFQDPGNLDKTFKFAELAIGVGDFEGAVGALERMLLIDPALPRVRLELGVLYYRLGSYLTAKTYLGQVLAAENVPPEVRERVTAFLAEIDSRLSPSSFSGSFYAGLRYQTNANLGPASPQILLGGFPAQLADEFVEAPDYNAFAALSLRHTYDFQTQSGTFWDTRATTYGSRQFTQAQVNILFIDVRSGPAFPIESISGSVRPFAKASYVFLEDDHHFVQYGGGLEMDSVVREALRVGGTAEAVLRDFQDSPTRPTNSNSDGPAYSLSLNAQYLLRSTTLAQLGASVRREETKVGYLRNTEVSGTLTLTETYEGPVDISVAPWQSSISVTRSGSFYVDPDSAVDPTTKRRDDEWRVDFTTAIPITARTSLIGTAGWSDKGSNLPNFENTNIYGSVGASIQF